MQQVQPVTVVNGGGYTNLAFQGQQTFLAASPVQQHSDVVGNYKQRQSIQSGTMSFCAGSVSICLGIADIVIAVISHDKYYYYDTLAVVGHGIWVGAMLVLAGSFGIAAGKRSSKCMITAYMALSIIASCLAPVQLGLAMASSILTAADCDYGNYYAIASLVMEILLTILGALGFASSLWGSIVCCKGIGCCCCETTTSAAPTYIIYCGAPVAQSTHLQQQQQQLQQQQQTPMIQAVLTAQGATAAPVHGYPVVLAAGQTHPVLPNPQIAGLPPYSQDHQDVKTA